MQPPECRANSMPIAEINQIALAHDHRWRLEVRQRAVRVEGLAEVDVEMIKRSIDNIPADAEWERVDRM